MKVYLVFEKDLESEVSVRGIFSNYQMALEHWESLVNNLRNEGCGFWIEHHEVIDPT